ncbi:unnamed protein product, partial [Prorocentrum cordatum]
SSCALCQRRASLTETSGTSAKPSTARPARSSSPLRAQAASARGGGLGTPGPKASRPPAAQMPPGARRPLGSPAGWFAVGILWATARRAQDRAARRPQQPAPRPGCWASASWWSSTASWRARRWSGRAASSPGAPRSRRRPWCSTPARRATCPPRQTRPSSRRCWRRSAPTPMRTCIPCPMAPTRIRLRGDISSTVGLCAATSMSTPTLSGCKSTRTQNSQDGASQRRSDLHDEKDVEGGVLEAYKCPPTENCRSLVMQDAYRPFAKEDAVLEIAEEASYKRGRVVFFLASTPHAVSELKKGNRDVLFVWIGCYPTLRSVGDGDVGLVTKLLEERADVNSGFSRGMTPLHFAVAGGHKPVTELLLEKRANPNAEEYYLLRSPVFAAAESGSANVVDKLVEFGADICLSNAKGVTPLQQAVSAGHDAVRDRLVALGAGRCPPGQPRSGKGRRPRPSVPTKEAMDWYRQQEQQQRLGQQQALPGKGDPSWQQHRMLSAIRHFQP